MRKAFDTVKRRRHGHVGRAAIVLTALISGAYAAGACAAVDPAQGETEVNGIMLVMPVAPQDGPSAQGGPGWNISRQDTQQAPNNVDALVTQKGPQVFIVPRPIEGGPGWTPIVAAEVPQGGPGWAAPDTLANFSAAPLPGTSSRTQKD